jgi:hypothetical protein
MCQEKYKEVTQMTKLIITARYKKADTTEYLPIEEYGLQAKFQLINGNGSPENPYHVKISVTNSNKAAWSGVIHIELPFQKQNPRFFLPAFMYGRNRGEAPQNVPVKFPRLREGNPSHPSSSWWMMRSDRLSHPTAIVFDTDRIMGLCASPYFIINNGHKKQWLPDETGEFYQYCGYSCSLGKGTVGYTLGYENAPLMFINAYRIRERAPLGDNCFELKPGETVDFSLRIFDYAAETELDINKVIKTLYYCYHQQPRKASDLYATVSDLSKAVYEDAWIEEDLSYAGQVFEDRNTGSCRFNKIFSLSWTNGLAAAVPMLMAAIRIGDEKMRQQALSCICNIIGNCMNRDSGLPYDAYNDGEWSNKGWWFDVLSTAGHSSYICGQAMFYILKAYEFEKRFKNHCHTEWIAFVKNVLERVERTKNTDYEYPYIFSEKTGAGIEYDSFGSVWCMAALAYFSWLTGDMSYLESLKHSEQHYYETFVRHMECYGTPLDTCKAVESEGILGYIKAVRFIHSITHDRRYLEHMKDAINYEFSFKFCYNSPIKFPPLSNLNWSSCGGSVTSVSNPHIHPMSSSIIGELLYYIRNCPDKYVEDRLIDTVLWSCQNHNTYDGEFDFGKKGWMSERFCYSEGLVYETYSDGSLASTWFCLMPWAIGSILEGLTGDYWDRNQE